MFALPLGLQARTRDFPWMTLLILAVTSGYSFWKMNISHESAVERVRNPQVQERFQKQKTLLVSACAELLKSGDCEKLKQVLEPERKESVVDGLMRVKLAYKDSGKNVDPQLEKIARYLSDPRKLLSAAVAFRDKDEYTQFMSAIADETASVAAWSKEQGLLTRSSYDWWTLLQAQFLHAGWMHLIGNMLFFLLFAIPVEQRIGPWALSAVYFIGGSAGLILHLMTSDDPTMPILGASANVFAVGAAFLVAFWAFSVRVWVSLSFIYNSIVLVPTWIFFAFFILLQEVTGAVSDGSNVAHIAHIGGFGIGILLGAIATQMKLLPRAFVFPFEQQLFNESRKATGEDRLKILKALLFYNPTSALARLEGWKVVTGPTIQAWLEMNSTEREFVKENLSELLRHCAARDARNFALVLETAQKLDWPWGEIFPENEMPRQFALAHESELKGKKQEALWLFKVLKTAHPQRPETRLIEARIEALEQRGEANARQSAGA